MKISIKHTLFYSSLGFALTVPLDLLKSKKDSNSENIPKAIEDIPVSISTAVGWNPQIQATEPFPQWLTDFTGLTEWPGLDPPYIPLDFINFTNVPNFPAYQQGICPGTRDSCSFDCFKCVEHDDVFTCPKLTQTFDDGPSPATTKLLSTLKNKTTFFTLGVNVVRYPEIYRKARDEGHLLGSHTWSHPFMPSLTNEQIVAQIEWSIWAQNATGKHLPKWWRPPYGGLDNRVRSITRQFGLQAVLWDYDTFDWRLLSNEITEDQILNEVRGWKGIGNSPSGLMLEHDGANVTVDTGIKVNDIIGSDQLKVSQCVGGQDYIKSF